MPGARSSRSKILVEREEKSSIALASNLPFTEWRGIIPDPPLVATIVDRVTLKAHIIGTGTESWHVPIATPQA
jgi:hypothetical protein